MRRRVSEFLYLISHLFSIFLYLPHVIEDCCLKEHTLLQHNYHSKGGGIANFNNVLFFKEDCVMKIKSKTIFCKKQSKYSWNVMSLVTPPGLNDFNS